MLAYPRRQSRSGGRAERLGALVLFGFELERQYVLALTTRGEFFDPADVEVSDAVLVDQGMQVHALHPCDGALVHA